MVVVIGMGKFTPKIIDWLGNYIDDRNHIYNPKITLEM